MKEFRSVGSGTIIFRCSKKHCKLWILYPVKISFSSEGEINTFSDKENQREFAASKPIPWEWLKEVLEIKIK